MGSNILGIESGASWATPKYFTELNYPCYENGANCKKTTYYEDPAVKLFDL